MSPSETCATAAMEGTDAEEMYLDLPADDVRPATGQSGGNSPLYAGAGEPDYHAPWGEERRRTNDEEEENPNRDDETNHSRVLGLGVQEELDRSSESSRLTTRTAAPAEPPYEQLPDSRVGHLTAATGRGAQGRDRPVIQELHQGGLESSGFQSRMGSGSKSVGRVGEGNGLLNGTAEVTNQGQRVSSDSRLMNRADRLLSHGNEGSLEQLVQQLLVQNAALQQELLETRGSSGSVSTGSHDGRLEGRGSLRTGLSDAGFAKRGKGIGVDSRVVPNIREQGRWFAPPWTSFAQTSESTHGLFAPTRRFAESEPHQPGHIGSIGARSQAHMVPNPAEAQTMSMTDVRPGFGPSVRDDMFHVPITAVRPMHNPFTAEAGKGLGSYKPSIVVDPQEDRIPMQVHHWKASPSAAPESVVRQDLDLQMSRSQTSSHPVGVVMQKSGIAQPIQCSILLPLRELLA